MLYTGNTMQAKKCSRCGVTINPKAKGLCQKCYYENQPQEARQKKSESIKQRWQEGCYDHIRKEGFPALQRGRQANRQRQIERTVLKATAQTLADAALSLIFIKTSKECRFCGLDKWPHEISLRGQWCKECGQKILDERKRLLAKGCCRCVKCLQIKPLSDFPKRAPRSGYYCKSCNWSPRLKESTSPIPDGTKICGKCGEEKPYSEFYKDSCQEDGYRWQCKKCIKVYDVARKEQRHENYLRLKEEKNHCPNCGMPISPWVHREDQLCPECAVKKRSQEKPSLPEHYHLVKDLLDESKESGTALEHNLAQALDDLGLDHITRRRLPDCPCAYDEYVPELNLLIEADGEYWHFSEWAQERGTPEKDTQKDQWAKDNGYHIIRIRERDSEFKGMKACLAEQLFSQLEF